MWGKYDSTYFSEKSFKNNNGAWRIYKNTMKRKLSALEETINSLKFMYLIHPQRQGVFHDFQLLVHRRHRANRTRTMLKTGNENQGNDRNIKPPVLFLVSRDLTSSLASTNNQLWEWLCQSRPLDFSLPTCLMWIIIFALHISPIAVNNSEKHEIRNI